MSISTVFRNFALGTAALTAAMVVTPDDAEARTRSCHGAWVDETFRVNATTVKGFDYDTGCMVTQNLRNGSSTAQPLSQSQFYRQRDAAERQEDNYRSQSYRRHTTRPGRGNSDRCASAVVNGIGNLANGGDPLRLLGQLSRHCQ